MEGSPPPKKNNLINDEVKEALSHIRDATAPDFSLYFIIWITRKALAMK